MSRRLWPRLVIVFLSCGRTEPVHYSSDGGDDWATRTDDGGVACVNGALALLPARPVVVLVLDRSGSMSQAFRGTRSSKWSALAAALHEALPPWGSSLELGALFFPSTATTASCAVGASADLAPALENVAAVLAKLDATSPGGSTPTAVALDSAGATLSARRTAGSARALVLATDGAPDCNAALNARTCTCVGGNTCSATRCLDDTRSLERLRALAAAGIPTWVVGLRGNSDALFVDVLNRMADAGGKPRTGGGERFYAASSQAELEDALGTIRQQVGVCRYLTPSVPDVGGSIELRLGDVFVPFDSTGTEGWSWIDADNGELVLHGAACARAQEIQPEAPMAVVQCSK